MNTVKLYYPSVDQDNKPLDQAVSNEIYKSLCKSIAVVSGGLTVTPCQGYYVNRSDELIKDDISLISVYTDKLDSIVKIIKSYSMIILKSLNQESVLIEIDNRIEFITDKNEG